MKVNNTTTYTFTKEEIEVILLTHISMQLGDDCYGGEVSWSIRGGDTGIKDPMDYSPYQPTEVTCVKVTV